MGKMLNVKEMEIWEDLLILCSTKQEESRVLPFEALFIYSLPFGMIELADTVFFLHAQYVFE